MLALIALKWVRKRESVSAQGNRVGKGYKKQRAIVNLGTIDLPLLLLFIV